MGLILALTIVSVFESPILGQGQAQREPNMTHGIQQLKKDLQKQDALINEDTKAYYELVWAALEHF